jgi:hypothetical protein
VPLSELRGGFQVADGLFQDLGAVASGALKVHHAQVVRQLRPGDRLLPRVDKPQRDVEGPERSLLVIEAAGEDVPVRVGHAQVGMCRRPVRRLILRRPRRQRGLE